MRLTAAGLYTKGFICLLLSFAAARACGPDFSPDVFVLPNGPDLDRHFVQGKLGLLQGGFERAYLLLAYRYLTAGTLDADEQRSLAQVLGLAQAQNAAQSPISEAPMARWVLARNNYPDAPPGPIGQDRRIKKRVGPGSPEYDGNFFNCADDAFRTAAVTLADRAQRWGSASPVLLDWLHAQDAVFAHCSGPAPMPAPAPPGSPALLASDRAYQIAAANFYDLAPIARKQFMEISKDESSLWQPIAGYLVARTLIRRAFFARTDVLAQATYDPKLMAEASTQLRSYLDAKPAPALCRAAEAELALVRIRVEPEQRVGELGALIAGPKHDSNYGQDLQDLLWYVDSKTPGGLRAKPNPYMQVEDTQHPGQMHLQTAAEAESQAAASRHDAYAATAPERALSPAIDWTLTFQSLDPAAGAHALAEWQRTQTLPWLIAALVLAPDHVPPQLLAASSAVPVDSPAWETATYHRIRLLLALGHADEARAVLADALPRLDRQAEPSSVNAFRGLAMRAAPTLAAFFEFAPRNVLVASSEEHFAVSECEEVMKNPRRHYNCVAEVSPEQLDQDAASILNEQAPLNVWLKAAQSQALSAELRQAIAMTGWTRSVLLHDGAATLAFLPLLPNELRAQTGDEFQQLLVLARNPGLNPYLNPGTQRAYSYDFVESFRDNWCYKPVHNPLTLPPAFLAEAEKKKGEQQASALAPLRAAALAQQLFDQAQAKPDDPRTPEALFLILRMIRYGCTEAAAPPASIGGASPQVAMPAYQYTVEGEQLFKLKQEAAQLLRRRYVSSPWTKKAAPFAG